MSILQEICNKKRQHVEKQKADVPLDVLKNQIEKVAPPRGFINKLKSACSLSKVALIAEVKKASPSKGVIRAEFNPVDIALSYENAGASCLSVLTDEPYFQGHDTYLSLIKNKCGLPILRKDFMVDTYQIYESRNLGADCILLIMAALDLNEATKMHDLAINLGMDVLVEVHNQSELDAALSIPNIQMLGVNNRNLKTMDVTLQTSHDLSVNIPDNVLKISESGIYTNEDIKNLQISGYSGFLIGESLMRETDLESATRRILGVI